MRLRRVNLGDIVTWDGRDWIVDAHGIQGTRLNPVVEGSPVWVDLATVALEASFEHHQKSDASQEVRERIDLARLDQDTHQDVLFWRNHLNEARFGVADPDDPDAVPRDGYGAGTTIEGRMELKAQELRAAGIKTSRTSLFRKDSEYRAHGVMGLLDGRKARHSTGPRVPKEVETAAHQVIAEHLGSTSRDTKYFLDKIKQRVRNDHSDHIIEWPSDRTLRRWLNPLLDAAGLMKSAAHRRSESNRPQRTFRPIEAMYPGQYVEIDSNTLDVETAMPDGQVIRPYMTAAVDVFSGSVVGFHIHGGAPSSTDHAVLFARIVSPRRAVDRLDPSLTLGRSKTLPSESMIAMGQATPDAPAMPFIAVETLTMDRGKDFLASRAAAEVLGWSVIDAPPHSPTAKPHVERFFNSVNSQLLARFDSYVGRSPEHRGRNARVPIPFTELVDQMWKFVISVYQNRPHRGLVRREHPGRTFTPNQMYAAAFEASAGIPLPLTEADYVGLMPAFSRTLRSDGIHLQNETYDSPALDQIRTHSGKVEVRQDPYDTDRAWVRHPQNDVWIDCTARSVRLSALPFGSTVSQRLAATAPADDPHAEWAQTFLDSETRRVKAEKITKRHTSTTNRDRRKQSPKEAKSTSRKRTKAATEKANRRRDELPRPAAVEPAPLAPVSPIRNHPDDYKVV
ncbi:Mu transposase C-terminal domain-containing protein [Gordonia sp. UBA7599]|uniref:Mu transposase C-terminal domain-containing protein n=2 Tax=Gordonia TaxID=2053 RepID=UPI000F9A9231|nr:Mu transposase C-terminal domain-containing protein [Gordonia sp. UBA7599]RUP38609.1 MAG: transposase [Gordonia sp. (in: high G+C Gram-positive bacteria)]HNP56215.1 Mu transposase C-terminal domain-containing protein [Gordonia sp. (in: high G+C Gram-positive bacteria)]